MSGWFCTNCGKRADPGFKPQVDADGNRTPYEGSTRYTQIDDLRRYDLGWCECSEEPVQMVADQMEAELIVWTRRNAKRARLEMRDRLDPGRVERRKAASETANEYKATYARAKREEGK